MVRLLLCRHGQTEWNVAHRFQGQSNSDLTPLGKRQAVRLGERLDGINIDAVYSSSLPRALDTARLMVGNRGFDIIPVDELKEIYLGKLEGLSFEEGERLYPDEMAHFWDLTSNTVCWRRDATRIQSHRRDCGKESKSDCAHRHSWRSAPFPLRLLQTLGYEGRFQPAQATKHLPLRHS